MAKITEQKLKLKFIDKFILLNKDAEGKELLKEYYKLIGKINRYLNK